MQILYNIIQLAALIVFAPFLFVKVILTPKYRLRILKRLGAGLKRLFAGRDWTGPRIWIHALSVGEVSSSIPLVKAIRRDYPAATIIVTATTRSGELIANKTMEDIADIILPFPIDLYWVVKKYIQNIRPDVLIMVETDFWPNFLFEMKKQEIPALLVNGRVSNESIRRYKKFKLLFKPLFGVFNALAMQTEEDRNKMISLGLHEEVVHTLGNLKYDMAIPGLQKDKERPVRKDYGIPDDSVVLIAGSTHPGEEKIILNVYRELRKSFEALFLVIAPRDVARGGEIESLAKNMELLPFRRTASIDPNGNVLVLDTLGELSGLYSLCDIVFMGGSLVPEGGHNPLEPACFAKPTLFGPHMEDFVEISRDLIEAGAAWQVADQQELLKGITVLLDDMAKTKAMGEKGLQLVKKQQGVTAKHVALIASFLEKGDK